MPKKNDTIATKITAPIIDGTIAIPANEGPQLPSSDCPIAEPIHPATTFAIIPIEPPLFVIAPAIAPMTPPTINDQINPIFTSFFHLKITLRSLLLCFSVLIEYRLRSNFKNKTTYFFLFCSIYFYFWVNKYT